MQHEGVKAVHGGLQYVIKPSSHVKVSTIRERAQRRHPRCVTVEITIARPVNGSPTVLVTFKNDTLTQLSGKLRVADRPAAACNDNVLEGIVGTTMTTRRTREKTMQHVAGCKTYAEWICGMRGAKPPRIPRP